MGLESVIRWNFRVDVMVRALLPINLWELNLWETRFYLYGLQVPITTSFLKAINQSVNAHADARPVPTLVPC